MLRKGLTVLALGLAAALTANAQTARIVKHFSLYNQNGSIGPVTLYTPTRRGLYRISGLMATTLGNKNGNGLICPTLTFTDPDVGKTGSALGNFCLGTANRRQNVSGATILNSVNGQPINLVINANLFAAGASYKVQIVVEEF